MRSSNDQRNCKSVASAEDSMRLISICKSYINGCKRQLLNKIQRQKILKILK